MNILKHIIMWLSLSPILASCTETAIIDEPEPSVEPRAIDFSTYYGWPGEDLHTRSTPSMQFTKGDKIKIFATHTENPDDNNFTSNFMKDQIVEFDGNVWTYSPIKYWPTNGKLTFRGYYPSSVKTNDGFQIATTHECVTGFEPLYGVEAVVNAGNGNLTGDISDDGKLRLGFSPLLNTVNFYAKAENGLFDEVTSEEYKNCRFLLLNFKIWGFHRSAEIEGNEWKWNNDNIYTRESPLDLTESLDKKRVSDVVPGYVYNPSEGYCIENAVVIEEGAEEINIFNKTLKLIPCNFNNIPDLGFEIQYVVLTNKVDSKGNSIYEGDNIYRESGIVTRGMSLSQIFQEPGQIKKLININLDFSIDGVTVTRNLEDYIYKPMF